MKAVPPLPSAGGCGPSQLETLSLLQAKHSLVAVGSSTRYDFLHVSIQELCAAYYVASLTDPEETHTKAVEKILLNTEVLFKSKMTPFQSVCSYYAALTGLDNLAVARQLHKLYDRFDLDCETANHGITNLDSKFIPSGNELNNISTFNTRNEALHGALINYFVIFGHLNCYRFSSFIEFLIESQNSVFVDEVVRKEMKMWVFERSERMLSTIVSMASSLESVTCFGFSEKLSVALCNKPQLKKFSVTIFDFIDSTTIATDFQGILNVLQTCPTLKDITIEVQYVESVADVAAAKLADVLLKSSMSLERCTIDALHSIQDDGVAALAPAFSRVSRVMCRLQQIGPNSLMKLAKAIEVSCLLNYFEICVYQYKGDDHAFFSSLKHAKSLKTVVLTNATSLPFRLTSIGRALLSGDLKLLADILGVNKPPYVKKVLEIYTFEYSYLKVDFENGIFLELQPVGCKNKYHYQKIEPKEVGNKMGPTEICKLTETLSEVPVKNLHLYAHNIGCRGAMLFRNALCKTECLEELTIRDCGIGLEGIALLFAGLTKNTTLATLDASYNCFGDDGALQIAELINNTNVQILDIGNCNMREKGVVAIALALTTNTTLKRLSLQTPHVIGQNTETELGKMLLKNRTLEMLAVNQGPNWYPNLNIDKEVVSSTFKMSKEVTLTLMNILGTDEFYRGVKMSSIIASIEIHSASSLGKALWSYNMRRAEEILLLHQPPSGENHIDIYMTGNTWTVRYVNGSIQERDEGLRTVHSMFYNHLSQITVLNLQGKRLGSVGACHLAKVLNQTQLQDLNIASCTIREGIISLAKSLSTNLTIRRLAIGGNEISPCGQKALAKSLSMNTSLTTLDIQTGRVKGITIILALLGDEEDFLEMIVDNSNSSLTKIIFDGCTPFGEGLEMMNLPDEKLRTYSGLDYFTNTIECQLRPFKVTKIYRKTNPGNVFYHCPP